uniref:PR/SET domain 14 n=1 Tax=Dromaius novaehollandiae TaxID=8790 RepID=A0A8C4P865_DRONO
CCLSVRPSVRPPLRRGLRDPGARRPQPSAPYSRGGPTAASPPAPPTGLAVLRAACGDVSQLGVFCTDPIPKGVRFGPFQGKVVNTSEIKTYDDNSLMWEVGRVRRDGTRHFIDGKGAAGNWMSLVNCARFPEEQNLTAIQCQGQIFYESCKEILPKQELLVWYGDCYVQFLGIPISLKGMPEGKRPQQQAEGEAMEKSLVCGKTSSILRTHIRQHSGEKPFKCKHCGKAFASHAAHDSHVRRTHSKDKGCACSVCGQHFPEQEELHFHMQFHTAQLLPEDLPGRSTLTPSVATLPAALASSAGRGISRLYTRAE